MPEHRPIVASARLIALCTLLSRITGLLRDMLLLQVYALAWVADAWNYAFQFPNLFRRLFAEGTLAAAFVPFFTRTLENEGREAAWRLLARTLALLTVVLVTVIGLLELVLLAIWLLATPADAQQAAARSLLLALTALMLPFLLTISVVALLASVLNCVGSFVPGALAPVILNVFMIGGVLWLGPRLGRVEQLERQIFGVALSVLVAGMVQVLLILPVLRRNRVSLGWTLAPRDPQVRRLLLLVAPVLAGQGILVLGPFLDTQLCVLLTRLADGPATLSLLGASVPYPLHEGALTALSNAARLYQFPLGVVAISLATAALPTFTRLANRDEWAAWKAQVHATLRASIFAGLLAGGIMLALAEPIVRLLFEYRNFTAADTRRVAWVVFWYGFAMAGFCAQHIVVRAFYSIGDVRTPLRLSCVLLPANLALTLALVWLPAIREAAFAISSAVTATVTVLAGLRLLERRSETRLLDGSLASAVGRMLAATVGGAALAAWVHPMIATLVTGFRSIALERTIETGAALALATGLYLSAAALLGLPETRLLLPRRRVSARRNRAG